MADISEVVLTTENTDRTPINKRNFDDVDIHESSFHNSYHVTPMKDNAVDTNQSADDDTRLQKVVRRFPPAQEQPYVQKTSIKHSSLKQFIEQYKLDEVKEYLKKYPQCINGEDSGNSSEYLTPLQIACQCGCLAVVSILVIQYKSKTNVNLANVHKQTPLWIACYYNYIAIVSLLLNSGNADYNICDHVRIYAYIQNYIYVQVCIYAYIQNYMCVQVWIYA